MNNIKSILIFLIPLLCLINSYTQSAFLPTINKYTVNKDVDDLLINGRYYVELYPNASGTSFFYNDEWQTGDVSIRSIHYDNIRCKYDLLQDKFILKHESLNGNVLIIEFNPNLIDSFRINEHLFITNKNLDLRNNYLELIYNGRLKFYRSYQKYYKKKYSDSNKYGEITNSITNSYLIYDEKIIKSNTKKNFINVFPKDKRKLIKVFISKNNIRFKKASNKELNQLLKYCDGI